MELTLFPRRKTGKDTTNELPRGMVHPPEAPCPLDGGRPVDPSATCCAFPAQAVADALEVCGEATTAEYLFEDLDETETVLIAYLLRVAATVLPKSYRERAKDDHGAPSGRMVDLKTGDILPWTRPEFEAVVTSIHGLADWYEKVGRLGFGVRARY